MASCDLSPHSASMVIVKDWINTLPKKPRIVAWKYNNVFSASAKFYHRKKERKLSFSVQLFTIDHFRDKTTKKAKYINIILKNM